MTSSMSRRPGIAPAPPNNRRGPHDFNANDKPCAASRTHAGRRYLPACESTRLARYPVHSEGGWFDVVKCQACLHSIRREPASRLGPVLRLLSDTL